MRYGLQANCNENHEDRWDICLDLVGDTKDAYGDWMDAFALARRDWEAVITGHVGSFGNLKNHLISTNKPIGTEPPEMIDDMYLVGRVQEIDGLGKTLGMGKLLLLSQGRSH
jgi:hypothetical protein